MVENSDDPPELAFAHAPPTEHSLAALDLFQRGLPIHPSVKQEANARPAVDAVQNIKRLISLT